MFIRRTIPILFLTLTLAAVIDIGPSVAQTVAPIKATQIEELLEQAKAHILARNLNLAVKTYLRVYELSKESKYLYNISMLYLKGLKDPVSAWKYAADYRKAVKDPTTIQEAEDLKAKIEKQLNGSHGRVNLIVTPPDARIQVDGKEWKDRMDGDVHWLPFGQHTMAATAKGYEPAETGVDVVKGASSRVTLHMKPRDAVLNVVSNVENSAVYLDEQRIGTAPLEKRLKPGSYVIRVEAEGHKLFRERLILNPGEVRTFHAEMQAVKPEPVPKEYEVARKSPAAPIDRKWAWASFGTGGAVAVVGVVLTVLGHLDSQAAENIDPWDFHPNWSDYDSAFDSKRKTARAKAYTGYGLMGLGVAAIGAGVALYLLSEEESGTTIVPSGPDGPGITAVMRW